MASNFRKLTKYLVKYHYNILLIVTIATFWIKLCTKPIFMLRWDCLHNFLLKKLIMTLVFYSTIIWVNVENGFFYDGTEYLYCRGKWSKIGYHKCLLLSNTIKWKQEHSKPFLRLSEPLPIIKHIIFDKKHNRLYKK